jgi:YfiR/HmsC-like
MKMRKFVIPLIFLLFACLANAQISEYEYKAAYIERFTRFIEWPINSDSIKFRIAVIGNNSFNTSLDELFDEIKVKNRNVELIYTNDISDLSEVDLVFIPFSFKKRVKEILEYTRERPILTISDSKGFCALGVHINMYSDNKYIRFEINQEALEKSKLEVSSLLLASASIVKTHD